jgi:hypothetical protein
MSAADIRTGRPEADADDIDNRQLTLENNVEGPTLNKRLAVA